MNKKQSTERIIHYADMFAAMGNDARLRIMRLLLSAHPTGMIVGDIQSELGIPKSTLSHHLDKLKNEELITVTREVRDHATGAVSVPADYSELGILLVTVTALTFLLPMAAIAFVRLTRFRTA